MDDLASTINQILGSEEGMNQLKTIADALGLNLDNGNNANFGGGNSNVNNSNFTPQQNFNSSQNNNQQSNSNPLAALSGLFGGNNNQSQSGSIPNIDPAMIFKLQSAFSLMSKEDHNTALLRALKPHMGEERQKKIDDAIKMMQLVRMLPLIKELGLFGGDDK